MEPRDSGKIARDRHREKPANCQTWVKARRGPKKAIMAVAASILTAAYHMLQRGTDYRDLGAGHFNGADKTKSVNRLLRKIENLGFEVTGIREKQAA
jgi:hypothetical protein